LTTSSPSCKIFSLGHILSLTHLHPEATKTTSSSQPHLLLKNYLPLWPIFSPKQYWATSFSQPHLQPRATSFS
jgi:hypothetical protein